MKHLDQSMAPILLFALVFASQLMAGFNSPLPLPPPLYGNHISILSLDGGGIKGIIPAVVLDHLDHALKALDPTTPLAYYFDVIAGSSTGGLMTAMLATPFEDTGCPLFTPWEIVEFYKENGAHIFNNSGSLWPLFGPKYLGTFLHNIARELLKETRLSQTLTNVAIPTIDIKTLKPVIFSNYKLETEPYLDAKLSDICIGTSAAPTYFPPYNFWNDGIEFNLIDGAAGNPGLVAVNEVIRNSEHTNVLLLSLGTGKQKVEPKYDAETAAKWGFLEWPIPLLDIVGHSYPDMTLYYLATVFPGFKPADHYLRIQEYNLDPSMDSLDDVTPENLDNLVNEGYSLLNQTVQRLNVNTFEPYYLNQTNAEALDSWAKKLYEERHLRLNRKSMEKRGRPFIEAVRVPFSRSQAT